MGAAAQAGAAPVATVLATLTGAGAAASGLAASGVGPAVIADGVMGFVLPQDHNGTVARYHCYAVYHAVTAQRDCCS